MKDEHKNTDGSMEDVFGEPISVYTTEQAIEDGTLFSAGKLFGRRVVLTSNLVATLKKEALAAAIIIGLDKVTKFTRPDLATYKVAGKKIYVDDNSETITIMLAEDY
jgi:type I site-specific restriction-modification system R (restriction) subunit